MSIFRWLRDAVDGIVGQIFQQVNIVQELVTEPLRRMVAAVTGGIWKGDGANRFAQEMTSLVIPSLTNLMNINNSFGNAIKKAQETMAVAMQQAQSLAQGLNDVYNAIF
jgi:uncharacterized protein YukE